VSAQSTSCVVPLGQNSRTCNLLRNTQIQHFSRLSIPRLCCGQFPEHGTGLTGCAKRSIKKELWLAALSALFCGCQETEVFILYDWSDFITRPLLLRTRCYVKGGCVFYKTNEMQLIQWSLLLSALYMFRAVFPPIIRSLWNCMCIPRYCHAFLLSTAGVVGWNANYTSGRQQESMTIPKAAHTVL